MPLRLRNKTVKQIRFLTSALEKLPEYDLPEIALAGKSNVGKSSLINHLFCRSDVAKTSKLPGKTRMINFFLVEEKCILVDLPGYGFAKRSKTELEKWGVFLENYFQKRKNLACVLLLVDIRRGFSKEDFALIQWADHFQKPLLVIFTKADTVSANERKKVRIDLPSMYYSVKDPTSRKKLMDKILQFL